ncbi:MAG TPA: hypothetical protein VMV68_08555 [Spirochaetia bacterium]|nr:hypothetical protein [Spirochaetia bacterium]
MTFFLIKKSFFDMWDNMITVFLVNLGFVLIAAAALYIPYLLSFSTPLAVLGAAIGVILFNVYTAAASFIARDIANYTTASIKEMVAYFKETWKAGVALGIVTVVQIAVLVVAMPFYFRMGGIVGMGAVSIIFWISVIWWLASQYYFGVRARLDSDVKKLFKKSFILLFDNTMFSIALAIGTIVIFAISAFTAFLLPGITTILIWHQGATKIRLLKYDYLEKNPEANRKEIPWDALLIDEKDRVGQRTLRGMIFPWKE